MCLVNNSKDFTVNNMEKNRIKRNCIFFSADFDSIDTSNVLNICKYLMKGTWYKTMFKLIKKIVIGLLTGIVSAPNYTKCLSLSNQKCVIQPTVIKGALLGLRQFLAAESPLKWWKILFISPQQPVFKIFNFLSRLFDHVSKRLD